MDASEMVFDDLEPVSVPVRLGSKRYALLEASEGAAVRWRNASMRGARMDKNSEVVMLGEIAEAEPVLVAGCLCSLDGTGKVRYDTSGNPVTVGLPFVLRLRPAVVKALFAKVKEISPGLEEGGGAGPNANGQGPSGGPTPGPDPTSPASPGGTAST